MSSMTDFGPYAQTFIGAYKSLENAAEAAARWQQIEGKLTSVTRSGDGQRWVVSLVARPAAEVPA